MKKVALHIIYYREPKKSCGLLENRLSLSDSDEVYQLS